MKKDKLSWAQMVCEAEDKGLTLIDFCWNEAPRNWKQINSRFWNVWGKCSG